MEDLQRTLITVGSGALGLEFAVGVIVRIAGGIVHRPFWKAGVRLYVGALAAAPLLGGLVLLTVPFWKFGDAWWIVVMTAPVGALMTLLGVALIRWVARMKIPYEGEALLSGWGRR
jgi:hypothetical protein